MIHPLTPKEKRVLEYIESYLGGHGYAPSYLEIKDHFGFASFNSVQRYLKQLQKKQYIHIPGGNQKRAITVLNPSTSIQNSIVNLKSTTPTYPSDVNKDSPKKEALPLGSPDPRVESLSLPLLGRVAAGQPIEALDHDTFIDVPSSMLRFPEKSFALTVEGESMIEDGILDGDIILVQNQSTANNGDTIVAAVEDEATVKRIFWHKANSQIELRPSNSQMSSMWYKPQEVDIKGRVVGLLRTFY